MRLRPRSVSGWTMAVFGALAVLMGVLGLLVPEVLLELLGFAVRDADARDQGDHTLVFMAASSMASLNMGVYYLVAVATEWRPFYLFTVIFRLVTFTVFTLLIVVGPAPGRFFGVALGEGVGAVATGVALLYEARRSRAVPAPARPAGAANIAASDVGQ